MADFRKWFLLLAVLAIVALPASAQLSCVITPGQPPLIRAGGLSELVGDVMLTCSGNAPVSCSGVSCTQITTNLQIFTSPAQVTNRVKAGTAVECPTGIACVTDSLLLVTDIGGNNLVQPVGQVSPTYQLPIVGLLQPNLVTGDVANTRNAILYPNVTIPYGTTTVLRVTNVRVASPPASNSLLPQQVFMLVSTNPYGAVPITNPTQTVAYVQPPMQFATRTCSDSAGAITTFQQCISQGTGTVTFNVKFTEGFALAFKPRGVTTQNIVGQPYNTETGLVWPVAVQAIGGTTWNAGTTSYADSGTKLLVRFTAIPTGVNIYVTTTQTVAGTSGGAAPLITGALVDPTTGGSVSPTCGANTYTALPVVISSGAGSATWEISGVTYGSTSSQKSISFGVVVGYTAKTSQGLPGLTGTTPGSVSGTLAPVSTVDYASTSAAIPRFLDSPTGSQVFAIVPCVSNLLFPFVTNAGGFDTGIALANTSLDNAAGGVPFNTSTQTGKCTVYYFNGTSSAPAPQTTATDVAPGEVRTFLLSSGGVPGATSSATGFQGYIIVRCNFQFAHGFAYITDKNVPSTGSAGYLALIIPDRNASSRLPDPFTAAGSGAGEQLTN